MKVFLTDYASYNNGSQFEFGHWLDLDQFTDIEELHTYIADHFKEADEESPLPCGSKREEVMLTDFEGFPETLYSEVMDFDTLFKFREYLEDQGLDNFDNEGDNLLSLWNEYCNETNRFDDTIYYFDEDQIFELIGGGSPMEIFTAGIYSEINWSDDYLVINGYNNIESLADCSTEINEAELLDWIIGQL